MGRIFCDPYINSLIVLFGVSPIAELIAKVPFARKAGSPPTFHALPTHRGESSDALRGRDLNFTFVYRHVFEISIGGDAGKCTTPTSRTLRSPGNSVSPLAMEHPVRSWFNYVTCPTSEGFIDSFLKSARSDWFLAGSPVARGGW